MSQPWPGPSPGTSGSNSGSSYTPQSQQQYALERAHVYLPPLNGHSQAGAMVLNDDYDDGDDDLPDLPGAGLGMGYAAGGAGAGMGLKSEKTVRRRSSKACDQCRKSKCKCERSSPQDPCRNCIMLGTGACPPARTRRRLTCVRAACTFLGPSRKRGPPKGYIDAIEARLHQTEALIGILLASRDSRARSVLEDLSEVRPSAGPRGYFWTRAGLACARTNGRAAIDGSAYLHAHRPRAPGRLAPACTYGACRCCVMPAALSCSRSRPFLDLLLTPRLALQDPLAEEIITRVDNSPYGHKGRMRGAEAAGPARSRPPPEQRDGDALQATQYAPPPPLRVSTC